MIKKNIIIILSIAILSLLGFLYIHSIKEENNQLKDDNTALNNQNKNLLTTIENNAKQFEDYKIDLLNNIKSLEELIKSKAILEKEKGEEISSVVSTDHSKLSDEKLKETVNQQLNKALGIL